MNNKELSLHELPDDDLVGLFYSLIQQRQQKEQDYLDKPTMSLAFEITELKKCILTIKDEICDGEI